jgi:hypothetical protein
MFLVSVSVYYVISYGHTHVFLHNIVVVLVSSVVGHRAETALCLCSVLFT